ncbi:Tungsten-containing aldehyde:ferredoxin oxidoreductase (EC [Olavius algarvensis associated proteobacterium Delta 3]|nr:Tungsten-containing aldehyde:ferredoxin oxidoreductase (EC [Olavius algarvensis associated proteobacterium Delta 3]
MYGWVGNILKVDLSSGEVTTEPTEPLVDDYIGGRGLGVRLIYDHYTPGTDAFDPGNPLIFNMGPLTGTALSGSGRVDVTALSPMSKLRAKSNFGAYWGPEVKYAGFDHIIITGQAATPSYLWIKDGDVEIRDAAELWGKDTYETQQLIKQELGDPEVKVVCIGPAGERLVRFACIITETGDAAGRTGMGAVMGSKNLKAIAVRASGGVAVAKPEEFLELSIQINNEIQKHPAYEELSQWGVSRGVHMMYQMGFFPVGYFEDVCWDEILEKYGAADYIDKNQLKNMGCFNCPNRCMNFISVPEIGKGVTSCEPFSGFTGAVWNLDMDVFWEATLLVNKLGMDCTETSASIGLLMELYHNKIITEKDTDGIAMERGSKEAILETIRKIAGREGYGDILAEGQKVFAEQIGADAVEKVDLVKGVAPHAYEFRAFKGTGLMQAVGHRGDPLPLRGSLLEVDWHHANDWFQQVAEEQFGDAEAAIPTSYKGKARSAVISEHIERVADNLGVCKWLYGLFIYQDADMATQVFNLVTGKDWDLNHLLKVSERVRNLERMFDVRQGLRRKDDSLPKKFFDEPLKSGPYKGEVLDREKFEQMKDEYYDIRGWDKETGIPTKEKLVELNLADVAEEVLGSA